MNALKCQFCGGDPVMRQREVHYKTRERQGRFVLHRVECACGALGRYCDGLTAALRSWAEPWQALSVPSKSYGFLGGYAVGFASCFIVLVVAAEAFL